MTKSVKMRLGCLAALLLIAIPASYLLGWVRTTAPVAAPLKSGNLLIQLEAAAEFKETVGIWPIVSTVTYPDVGPIRGSIRSLTESHRSTDYKITLSSGAGITKEIRCDHEYHDACYFNADLGQTDLTKGVLVSVTDARSGEAVLLPQHVDFTRTSTYSFALWDALMSV